MKRSRTLKLLLTILFSASALHAAEPVLVRLTVGFKDPKDRELMLVSREKDTLFYRLPNSPEGVQATLPLRAVADAEFVFKIDEAAELKAWQQGRPDLAGMVLMKAVSGTLPYLDLPGNNAVEPVAQAAEYFMKSADALQGAAAAKFYNQALAAWDAVSRARWHVLAEIADLQAVRCQLGLGKLDEAEKRLEDVRDPSEYDASFGIYWLAKSEMYAARGMTNEAIDSVARSVAFETKDLSVFPDALRQSAEAYAAKDEWFRVRDVNYELARLFRDTSWGRRAARDLDEVMQQGHTRTNEENNAAQAFFGADEDMNELADKLLEELKQEDQPSP